MAFIKTNGSVFWALTKENDDEFLLFQNKNDAINKLTEYDEPDTCQIISIKRESNEWIIEQVSWQEIASALIKKVRK